MPEPTALGRVSSTQTTASTTTTTASIPPSQSQEQEQQQQQSQPEQQGDKLEKSWPPPLRVVSKIPKPDIDDREYRLLTLANGLDVLIVSDPTTDRSSAALDVHVGHLSDPEDALGLAHALEHILFLGTKKYPVENDYSQFVSDVGGGYSNAFTAAENTNYYFEVSSEGKAFEGALDRFAQFFISPLFLESCTERELKAVDSEHKKNLQDDTWRLQQLEQDLSNPGHPYSKFGTGNWETLHETPLKNGINIRDKLIDFHRKYYSANIMKLVVLGKESLDTLSEWVIEKFSEVENKGVAVPTCEGHPLGDEQLGVSISLTDEGVRNWEGVVVNVFQYIRMLQEVEVQEWIYSECQTMSMLSFRFQEKVSPADFTSWAAQNLHQYEPNHVLLGPYLMEECDADLISRLLNLLQPDNFRATLVHPNHDADDNAWLIAPWYGTEYKVDDVPPSLKEALANLTLNPDLSLPGKNPYIPHQFYVAPPGTKEERPFPFIIRDTDTTRVWYKLDTEYHVPRTNVYFFLRSPTAYCSPRCSVLTRLYVDLVKDALNEVAYLAEMADLYYALDTVAEGMVLSLGGYTDKLHVLLAKIVDVMRNLAVATERFKFIKEELIRTYKNFENENPDHHSTYYVTWILQERLWTSAEKLQELETIDAGDVASYYPSILNPIHIEALVHGTVDRHTALHFADIIETGFAGGQVTTTRTVVDEATKESTTVITIRTSCSNLAKEEEDEDDRVDLLGGVGQDSKSSEVSGDTTAATESASSSPEQQQEQVTVTHLPLRPVAVLARFDLVRTYLIPETPLRGTILRRPLPNPSNPNNAIEFNLQVGDMNDDRIRAFSHLFDQMASEPCFDMLRTKEQLGYIAWCGLRGSTGALGIRVQVQSERDPNHLENRIEAFLVKMRGLIVDMTDEEYNRHVATLATKLLQTDKYQSAATYRLWGAVGTATYDFDRLERDARNVKGVLKGDMVRFFDEYLGREGLRRRKLSVQIWSRKDWDKLKAVEKEKKDGVVVDGKVDAGVVIGADVGEVKEVKDEKVSTPTTADTATTVTVNGHVESDSKPLVNGDHTTTPLVNGYGDTGKPLVNGEIKSTSTEITVLKSNEAPPPHQSLKSVAGLKEEKGDDGYVNWIAETDDEVAAIRRSWVMGPGATSIAPVHTFYDDGFMKSLKGL
ncbi:Insulinase (Peptidase M16) [Blyttiomyces sp. JEL0837]|nr:Insulinase (Peptidase M16) [Blyttiomyces sp. JEL0837]